MAYMKTTIEIKDELLLRAKREAKRAGVPLRAIVEEGLRLALEKSERSHRYVLEDLSVGNRKADDPLETLSWQDLRGEIYGDGR